MSRNPTERVTRRTFLIGASTGMAALAGCSGSGANTDSTPTPTPTPPPTTTEKPKAEFKIQELVTDSTFKTGDTVTPQATIKNVGEKTGTVVLKFSLGDQQKLVQKKIDPGSPAIATTSFETANLGSGEYNVTVKADGGSVSNSISLFQAPESGFYGRLKPPGDSSMEGQYIELAGNKGEKRDSAHSAVDEEGFFTIGHLFERPYQARLSFTDQDLGDFDGLPPVMGIFNGQVNVDQKFVGTVELPRAYRTEVRLVNANGEPITDLQVGIRDTSSGYGVYYKRFTLTSDGYLKVRGATKTGVPAPSKSSDLKYQIELEPKAEDERQKLLGTIYGSPEVEEFKFVVENPSQYK